MVAADFYLRQFQQTTQNADVYLRERMSRTKRKLRTMTHELSPRLGAPRRILMNFEWPDVAANARAPFKIVQQRTKPLAAKHGFALGVVFVLFTQWLFMQKPNLFPMWVVAVTVAGFAHRARRYYQQNLHYFLIDFCYFANVLTIVNIFMPDNVLLSKLVFAFANGPLLVANIGWRVSLVFQNGDKMYSGCLHLLPALWTFLARWSLHEDTFASTGYGVFDAYGLPLLAYIVWQVAYLFITEVVRGSYLASHPDVATSVRWIGQDEKNALYKFGTGTARFLGMMKTGERFDTEVTKFKVIFVSMQLVYTAACLLVPVLCYCSFTVHVLALLGVLGVVVNNGSGLAAKIDKLATAEKQRVRAAAESYKYSEASPSSSSREELPDNRRSSSGRSSGNGKCKGG